MTPYTCLVVSDDEFFTLIQDLLANERCAMFHARTGMAAIRWLSERREPTILVLDLPLADMSGGELIASTPMPGPMMATVCLAGASARIPHRALCVVRKPSTTRYLRAAIDDARRQLAMAGREKAASIDSSRCAPDEDVPR